MIETILLAIIAVGVLVVVVLLAQILKGLAQHGFAIHHRTIVINEFEKETETVDQH